IFALSRALAKLSSYDTRPKLTPSTRQFFLTLAETSTEAMKTHFRNLASSDDPKLIAEADRAISRNPLLHAIMRNTIAPWLLIAGFRSNVMPGSAEETINFRTIPGTTAAELIDEIKTVINDPAIEVKAASAVAGRAPLTAAVESPKSGALYEALIKHA